MRISDAHLLDGLLPRLSCLGEATAQPSTGTVSGTVSLPSPDRQPVVVQG